MYFLLADAVSIRACRLPCHLNPTNTEAQFTLLTHNTTLNSPRGLPAYRLPQGEMLSPANWEQSVWRSEQATCLFLDTRAYYPTLDINRELVSDAFPSGQYCQQRRVWLKQELLAASTPVYIFLQHAPFTLTLRHLHLQGIAERHRLADLLARFRDKIRYIFWNESQRPIAGLWQGTHHSTLTYLAQESLAPVQVQNISQYQQTPYPSYL
ncbi:hypothetical protein SAMN05421831_101120 [Allopseudospirillum japonicum]|uniref:Uncharacterized protein n=1 Tax=Allopseudospirillum japonicum TaxID=64971 RepID=A0A1H6QD36_9GAMM|nr:hypothetical protein [Allopseudospirillum japonicum]SEI38097.1 hypothetical protein SAMN05421831_101120 [Allopseudospirillum japonicum]